MYKLSSTEIPDMFLQGTSPHMRDTAYCTQNSPTRNAFDRLRICSTTVHRPNWGEMSMTTDDKRQTRFSLFCYEIEERLILGYHCPSCGVFYRYGRYGIETGEYVVCEPDMTECPQCRTELPAPFMWNSVEEARNFHLMIGTRGHDAKIKPKKSFVRAWFDFNHSQEHQRKQTN